MKTNFKLSTKILSLVISVIMIVSLIPMVVSADDALKETLTFDPNNRQNYKDTSNYVYSGEVFDVIFGLYLDPYVKVNNTGPITVEAKEGYKIKSVYFDVYMTTMAEESVNPDKGTHYMYSDGSILVTDVNDTKLTVSFNSGTSYISGVEVTYSAFAPAPTSCEGTLTVAQFLSFKDANNTITLAGDVVIEDTEPFKIYNTELYIDLAGYSLVNRTTAQVSNSYLSVKNGTWTGTCAEVDSSKGTYDGGCFLVYPVAQAYFDKVTFKYQDKVERNSKLNGCYLYVYSGSSATITNCDFSDVTVPFCEGAVYANTGGSITVKNCTFKNIKLNGYAGGTVMVSNNANNDCVIEDCTFENNSSKLGSDIFNWNNTVKLKGKYIVNDVYIHQTGKFDVSELDEESSLKVQGTQSTDLTLPCDKDLSACFKSSVGGFQIVSRTTEDGKYYLKYLKDGDAFDLYKEDQTKVCDSLGDTYDSDACAELITAAKGEIDELKYDSTKTYEENIKLIDDIVTKLKADLENQVTVEKLIDDIDKIEEPVTLAEKDEINQALEKYNALPEDFQKKVTNYDKLKTAEVEIELLDNNKFIDVEDDKWYAIPILKVAKEGYMAGTSSNTFSPNDPLTRAMLAVILAKIDGVNLKDTAFKGTFADVEEGRWYSKQVEWAAENGITAGVGNGYFAPYRALTRQEMVQMIYKYAISKGLNPDLDHYPDITTYDDYSEISSWAVNAMRYAVGSELITGNDNKLMPKDIATRAQAAVIIDSFKGRE